ncbi:MAG: FkbM family methyltransferase [Acidobacteriota bacterium]
MGYTAVKKITRSLGIYRQAVWFQRHFLNRTELDQEKADLAFFSRFVQPDDLVFDVGANYGNKSRVFLKLGARVVAFEPLADCLEEWEARHGSDARLTTVQAAVASAPGMRRFFVRPNRVFSGFIEHWAESVESEILVPTVTLDQMIAKYGEPAYIKIDVEGYELEVLQGLTRPIRWISFEYHLTDVEVGKVINCVRYLSGLGPITINLTPAEDDALAHPDWLTIDQFLDRFPRERLAVPGGPTFGDIFVAMK